MKVGLIGFGNMAQAMVKGWLREKVLTSDQIYATASRYEALKERAAAYGIHALPDNRALAQTCDVIILAVKPYMIAKATEGCLEAMGSKMIISV
ncbi:MAG: NAD(P)-binding domain-containing protein, partial [Erysipelotrichaceae bacterium]|nr:NAD(P)-binding domain-containing protein [Erysipelotrichaceae bacterium]